MFSRWTGYQEIIVTSWLIFKSPTNIVHTLSDLLSRKLGFVECEGLRLNECQPSRYEMHLSIAT